MNHYLPLTALLLLFALPSAALPTSRYGTIPVPPAPPPADSAASALIVEPFQIKDEAEFFGLLNLQTPGMAAVRAAVEAKDWTRAKQAWADHLKDRTNARWFWSYRDRAEIARLLDQKKQPLSRAVPGADNVLVRKFNFVGVPKTLDRSPEWHQGVNDWTSVLNRFPYFVDLGQAYWATGDSKYTADFVFLLKDWVAKNPAPDGVKDFGVWGNPWRTLEAGLRVQSWLNGMQFFGDAPAFDADAAYQMTRSLVEHARYLRAVDFRRGYRGGNWQVIEATGSAEIGMMFPEFREAAGWRGRAFYTLAQHMQRDVYPDGAHHELTPGYHMAVMDQYLQVSLLAQRNGYVVPGLLDRHEKMYEFLEKLSKPDRIQPPIADSGKQPLEGRMADGALLYGRRDFRFFGPVEAPANWVWTFGPDAFKRYAKLNAERPKFTSVLLPDAQYAMLRTGWEKSDSYLLLDMAPWGGGHSHQDRLQVIAYAGRDLLVDPGQYGYDQPLANTYFRTSAAHNVLMVDGVEQPDADPKVVAWQTTTDADFVSGSILAKGLSHQRSVLFLKPNVWVIVDHVRMSGAAARTAHEITRLFHFAPTNIIMGNGIASTRFPDGKNLQVQTLPAAKGEIRQGWIAVAPAKADAAPVAAFTTTGTLPQTLVTVLTAFGDSKDLPKAELVQGIEPGIAHLRLLYPDGSQTEIKIADTVRDLRIGDVTGRGRAFFVTISQAGQKHLTLGG